MRLPLRAGPGRRATLPARLALAAVAVVVSLLLAEALLRALAPALPPPVEPIYRASEVPGLGYTLVPSLDTRALRADLRTNALGFRGPDWSTTKPAGRLRIALIGDSHAFGYGVPFDATVGEVLARLLRDALGRPVEVLNFGVSGYNAWQQRSALLHVALGFSPDVVVLLPCNNDDEPALFVTADGYLTPSPVAAKLATPATLRDGAWRSELAVLATRAARRLVAVATGSATTGTLAASPAPASPHAVEAPAGSRVAEPLDAVVGRPLRDMIEAARGGGARVILASFAGPLDWRRMFQQVAREEQLPLVELLELFPEARDWDEIQAQFGLGWDPHLGAEAHRRFAVALAGVLATPPPHAADPGRPHDEPAPDRPRPRDLDRPTDPERPR